MSADVGRVVALGASNLTRGLRTVVASARAAWGPDVEILAALGRGRSYGARGRFAFRTLPGILESGLWAELQSRPPVPMRALVTDVGNDVLYGFSVDQTLVWVDEALSRLSLVTRDIVLTDLPLASARRLSNLKFLAFRSVVFPSCRLSLAQALDRAERVNEGLSSLAATHGARFFRLDPAWYGLDPIHVRPSLRRKAWQRILDAQPRARPADASAIESLELSLMRPERRWVFGFEQLTSQSGVTLPAGGRVWLY